MAQKDLQGSKNLNMNENCNEINVAGVADLKFLSDDVLAIPVAVRNTFDGYLRIDEDVKVGPLVKQAPIARPTPGNFNPFLGNSNYVINGNKPAQEYSDRYGGVIMNGNELPSLSSLTSNVKGYSNYGNYLGNEPYENGSISANMAYGDGILSKRFFNSVGSLGPFLNSMTSGISKVNGTNGAMNGMNGRNRLNGIGSTNGIGTPIEPYKKWSNTGSDIFQTSNNYIAWGPNENDITNDPAMTDLSNKMMSVRVFPTKSQIKRQQMSYYCKFGEFGASEGQFTEPNGVAVNAANDIIVADTNNHRIQIFDKEGRFKFQFGECGKRDGQLLYPNRVAVMKSSGDIIVTERSPTHQIQIYTQYGQFVRKFGAAILRHPRGVTADNKGRIIVVECKVMRVLIFDLMGMVLQKFECSKHLEFPNGVVVNDWQEIFISDNRAHCVKVFNYEGMYLRQIGSEGITNYPIGVAMNASGEILIADNHNNFNLTIFTQDGALVSALESKVKHAQCFDIALIDGSDIVLSSKDYRLYIYRYVRRNQNVPPPVEGFNGLWRYLNGGTNE